MCRGRTCKAACAFDCISPENISEAHFCFFLLKCENLDGQWEDRRGGKGAPQKKKKEYWMDPSPDRAHEPIFPQRALVLDTETTGLSKQDVVVHFGYVYGSVMGGGGL